MNARLTDAEIVAALEATAGNVSHAAARLGCNRNTLYRRVARSKTLQEVCRNSRETLVDQAESVLTERVASGEQWAVTFVLKTLGKHRGYHEKTDDKKRDDEASSIKIVEVRLQ